MPHDIRVKFPGLKAYVKHISHDRPGEASQVTISTYDTHDPVFPSSPCHLFPIEEVPNFAHVVICIQVLTKLRRTVLSQWYSFRSYQFNRKRRGPRHPHATQLFRRCCPTQYGKEEFRQEKRAEAVRSELEVESLKRTTCQLKLIPKRSVGARFYLGGFASGGWSVNTGVIRKNM